MDKTGGEHLAGAQKNEAFAINLHQQGHFGWAVTVMFYSAVHYTRGYLASCHGLRVVRHDDMKGLWKTFTDLAQIRSSYDLLKEKSHAHRYYLVKFTDPQVSQLLVHLQKIKKHLEPLIMKGNTNALAKIKAVP